MKQRILGIAVLALGLGACVSTNVVQLGSPGRFPPVHPDSVRVFLNEADVKGEFEKVALINAEGDYNFANDERMVKAMKKRAAKLGANAIVIGEFKDPSTAGKIAGAVLGVGAERKGQVLAIRLAPAETPKPEP